MKFKAMPFDMDAEYLLKTKQDGSGCIEHFIAKWNGFSFCTHDDQDGDDMLWDRTVISYVLLSGEGVK